MATVRQIADVIEEIFPPENVCMQDYIGLMTGSYGTEVNKVLLCLDCTESTVREAAEKGASLIVSHHPLIFGTLDRVTDETHAGKIVLLAAAAGISVYSAHTNMDCTKGGIGDYVAEILGITDCSSLVKINENAGLGVVGDIKGEFTTVTYAEFIGRTLSDKYVKIYGKDSKVRRVAFTNGAGGDTELIEAAAKNGADCYVTGEIRHHAALRAADLGVNLIEVGHYAAERAYIPRLAQILSAETAKRNMKIQFTASESECDPAL